MTCIVGKLLSSKHHLVVHAIVKIKIPMNLNTHELLILLFCPLHLALFELQTLQIVILAHLSLPLGYLRRKSVCKTTLKGTY